ncbi:hypothetical protein VSDG_05976 [Cytospora chrysosperma]|uniref:Protein kinase domain-containing protein n=1 Tax=Cytospora chrysosperma TaxID=252740 RepID=A0A423VTK3_CYTCH|nr:hypothetical protein VSDG_05976 [Valsa sordida]
MEFDPPFDPLLNTFASNAQSSGQEASSPKPPSATSTAMQDGDFGRLLWAPHHHRPDIKPTLRFFVESLRDGSTVKNSIKYLTLHQVKGHGIRYDPSFFTSELFQKSEPFSFPNGNWNHGTVSFFKEEDYDEEGVYYIWAGVVNDAYMSLPVLDPKAIWPEIPVVEYVDLSHPKISLRETTPIGTSDRIRVVTHEDFKDHETKLVMKIWPSPMCNTDGIEREMMAYRACNGKDITPKFLGHVAEEGRIIGMLIEYIEGAHKPSNEEEKELCRQELDRFHRLTGWHRNPMENHKGNFIIKDGSVYIIDLARAYTPEDVASKGSEWLTEKV